MSDLVLYCHDVHERASAINYLTKIGVGVVLEKVDNQTFLRLECPLGAKMELSDLVTIEPRYRITCPLGGFAVIHLRRPPLSNGEQQYLLSISTKEYEQIMEAEHADS